MLLRQSISDYRHLDLGNIKLAFTQVCKDELFQDVYFSAHALYYVQSGSALLYGDDEQVSVRPGELVRIKQHSKLDICKYKDESGKDFSSIIFYLFPDYVDTFVKAGNLGSPDGRPTAYPQLTPLKRNPAFGSFCEHLFPDTPQKGKGYLQDKTFQALHMLLCENKDLLLFLAHHSTPLKIDLYEFMIHSTLSNYSIPEFARLTGRSLSSFKRDFKAIFNVSPHQWILKQKLDYAGEILRAGEQTAKDIYYYLGFKELAHFSAAFKKHTGTNPREHANC